MTTERTYQVLGVPLRTGSYCPGSENDAQAYRDARLVARLRAAGCNAVDDGDVAIPSYLPHHAIPPFRNWPGPRIAWDHVADRIGPILRQPGQVPLLIGCDCSVVVGSVQALRSAVGDDVHVLYIDGDFDDAAPEAERCQSAAAMAVWLMTRTSPFWAPPLAPSQVTVIGWSNGPQSADAGVGSVSLADVRRLEPRAAAAQVLAGVPSPASVLLHLDIDVFQRSELPAAYFPHTEGLRLNEARELLRALLDDPRIRIVEIAEYASLRDGDHQSVEALIDLLADSLRR